MINVENQLRSYRHHKEAIAMIQSQLDQLENGKIKISKITDEIFGGGVDIYSQYDKLIVKKDKLRFRMIEYKLEVAASDKALELLSEVMPEGCEALKMKYLYNKQNGYIADILGYDKRTIIYKIQNAKKKFVELFEEITV